MKGFGNREIRAISDTIGGLLVGDYTAIRILTFVIAIVPVAIIMVALTILVILALLATAATTAATAFAFSHYTILYKANI
jgi:hypothetical protein